MYIYIANDNDSETTWVVKSKDLKKFRQEFDWLPDCEIRKYSVNNLHEICIAVERGTGQHTGHIYK